MGIGQFGIYHLAGMGEWTKDATSLEESTLVQLHQPRYKVKRKLTPNLKKVTRELQR